MDYWADVLADIPQSYKEWFKEEKKYLYKNITENAKVLEVGCGDGRSVLDILDKTNDITGIDHDVKIVLEAQKRFAKYPQVQIIQAEASVLPFNDKSFDFVVCMATFCNFSDKKFVVLEEMKRVLRRDGKIIISVFSEDAFEERMKLYKRVEDAIKEIRGSTVIFDESAGANVSEQFSRKELEDIFTKVNFKIDNITKLNIAYLCTLSLGDK